MELPEHQMIETALQLGEYWHEGQKRKFSGEPYFTHPKKVALSVWEELNRYRKENGIKETKRYYQMVAAALLHDVIEDTEMRLEEFEVFGKDAHTILSQVLWLTNDKGLKGKRKWRKFAMCERMRNAPLEAKLIKLVDRWDNIQDFAIQDPEFLKNKYGDETRKLVKACHEQCFQIPTIDREYVMGLREGIWNFAKKIKKFLDDLK